jgi:hypothetical protein
MRGASIPRHRHRWRGIRSGRRGYFLALAFFGFFTFFFGFMLPFAIGVSLEK